MRVVMRVVRGLFVARGEMWRRVVDKRMLPRRMLV